MDIRIYNCNELIVIYTTSGLRISLLNEFEYYICKCKRTSSNREREKAIKRVKIFNPRDYVKYFTIAKLFF